MKFTSKLLIAFIACIIFLSLSLTVLFQFEGFRGFVFGIVLNFVNDSLAGKIEITDLKIYSDGTIEILNARLLAAGDTVAFVPRILVDVRFQPLLEERIIVESILLESPVVKILRSRTDSTLNVEHIGKPSTDTTKGEPSNMFIQVKQLEMTNATYYMIDSLKSEVFTHSKQNKQIAFENLHLEKLNIKLNAEVYLNQPKFTGTIQNISLTEMNSGFELSKLEMDFELDTTHIKAKNLKIKTPQSDIALDAKADKFNLFGGLDEVALNKLEFEVDLKTNPVKPEDVSKFAELPVEFDKEVRLSLNAKGNTEYIKIEKLDLAANKTKINLKGAVSNILKTKEIKYQVDLKNSFVDYGDLAKMLPKGTANSIPDFNFCRIKHISIQGKSDTVYANVDINSGLGSVEGDLAVGLKKTLNYYADITTDNVEIGKIIQNNSIPSLLDSKIKVTGSGTDFKNLTAKADIQVYNSQFMDFNIHSLNLQASISPKAKIIIDTLLVKLYNYAKDSVLTDTEMLQVIKLGGELNFGDMSDPAYNINTELTNINVAHLIKNSSAPNLFSGKLKLTGSGLELDSIALNLDAEIEECMFYDRSLMPFGIKANITRNSEQKRRIDISSELLNLSVYGDFLFTDLIEHIVSQSDYFVSFINSKLKPLFPSTEYSEELMKREIGFTPLQFYVEGEIKDISMLNLFLGDNKLFLQSNIDIDVLVTENSSEIRIDSLIVNHFQFSNGSSEVIIKPTKISGVLAVGIENSIVKMDTINCYLESNFDAMINGMMITKPYLNLNFNKELLNFKMNSGINDIIDFSTNGRVEFFDDRYAISLTDTEIKYLKNLKWTSVKPISVEVRPSKYVINQLELTRENAETITLSGEMANINLENISLNITHFPLKDLSRIMPDKKELFDQFVGKLDSLNVLINGPLNNPEIKGFIRTDYLKFKDFKAGIIQASFLHKDSLVTGSLSLFNRSAGKTIETFKATINSLPINLGLTGVENRLHTKNPIDVKIIGNDVPLAIVSPFIPNISKLSGLVDLELDLVGKDLESLDYKGFLKLKRSYLLVDNINMGFYAEGLVNINKDLIKFDNIIVKNHPDDLRDGKANIEGEIKLKNFDVQNFDFKVRTSKLKVLSKETVKSMPNLYGDFVIASGDRPIRFYGNFDAPNLSGDINVLNSSLNFVPTTSNYQKNATIIYEINEKTIKVTSVKVDTSSANAKSPLPPTSKTQSKNGGPSFADLIDYDINCYITGRFLFNMNLGFLGNLFAEIGTPDKTVPLHYIVHRGKANPMLTGELTVKDGSSLKYLKQFSATGNINFPTGSISNPGLNLSAVYNGQSYINGDYRQFKVIMNINGTLNYPSVKFSYVLNNEEAIGDSTQISQDALFLLAFGKRKTELSASSQGQGNLMNDALSSSISSLISQSATSALSGTGIIQSVDMEFNEGNIDIENARLKLSGQLFGNMSWRVGGTVADLTNNYEFSIDLPLPIVLHPELLNNVIFQLTRAINTTQITSRYQKEWEIKLKFGGSW